MADTCFRFRVSVQICTMTITSLVDLDCVDLEDERLRLRDFEDRLPSRHIASILLVRVSISLESPSIEAEEVCEQAQADRDDG
ncbi:Hypothetical predicted protein [Octopus vulgaris]|uniref:Uncharacterized protein n=1 Tax=Octopus vulgaris TaxID=6645 RepID=A0AA36BEK4_OCTVU|nr:Hypothetical predicted protein [Octopus vulgaris]